MKKATLAAIALILAAAAAFSQTAGPDPWPFWRGPNKNGVVSDTAWNPKAVAKASVLWKLSVGTGYASACVAGGYVYTSGMKTRATETVYCLDPKTGAVVWTFDHPSGSVEYPGSRGTPVYENGRLYFMSLQGYAYCLDAKTGKSIWDTDIAGKIGANNPTWGFSSSALIDGNLVYFNVGKAGTALDKATGKIVWKSAEDAAGYATPVAFTLNGTRLLAIFGSRTLTVVEALTGKAVASVDWVTSYDVNAGDPVVVGNTIFIGSDYGKGSALFTLADGKLTRVWKAQMVLPHYNSAVYLDGFYYVGSGTVGSGFGTVCCLDAKTGKVAWAESMGIASLMAAGGNLVITTETGDLVVAKASSEGYTEISRATGVVPRLCWTAPVVAGGRVYLRSDGGTFLCMDVSK